MDRFGIFVDAGYLFAASGELCFKVTDRNKLAVDVRSVASALVAIGVHSGLTYSPRRTRRVSVRERRPAWETDEPDEPARVTEL